MRLAFRGFFLTINRIGLRILVDKIQKFLAIIIKRQVRLQEPYL